MIESSSPSIAENKDLRMIKNEDDLDLINLIKKYYNKIIKKLKLK